MFSVYKFEGRVELKQSGHWQDTKLTSDLLQKYFNTIASMLINKIGDIVVTPSPSSVQIFIRSDLMIRFQIINSNLENF